jgi:hypothetical protein
MRQTRALPSPLWGIAENEGAVPPLASPVLDVLPALADLRNGGRERITIRDVACMRDGTIARAQRYLLEQVIAATREHGPGDEPGPAAREAGTPAVDVTPGGFPRPAGSPARVR